jgi:hypothetical protein
MINFRYRLCRLMEFFLDKRIVKKQRSMIAVGGHPLPDNWVYPKKLRHADLRLPPCAGGPIPTAYAREKDRSVAVFKMVDDNADVEESAEVKERNEMQLYLILSFVDCTGTAKTSNYTIRRSRAGQSIKTRLCLKIIRGVNQTSKPCG